MKTWITKIVVTMVAVSSLIACQKSGSTNPTPAVVPTYNFNGCSGCGFANQQMFSVPGTTAFGDVAMNAQFVGDSNQMSAASNLAAQMGGCAVHKYQGQVAVRGTLTISNGFYAGSCWVPPGQYQMNTVQAGTYTQGIISIPAVEAVASTQFGAIRLMLKLGSGANGGNMVVEDSLHDCNIDRIAGPVGFTQMISQTGGTQMCNDVVGSFLM